MRLFCIQLFLLSILGLSAQNNARFVNVFIGTDGTGHTFPGPSMPFGMVQPGPDNRDQGWNYTSGYQYRDSLLAGFSQTRFSGTGINEMGDILLLPFAGNGSVNARNRYFKKTEHAEVGYYSLLKKDSVKVELTCSERVAFHRYTFPTNQATVLADFQHGLRFLTDSLVLSSDLKFQDSQTISGYCRTRNWVERTYFFVIKFDKPIARKDLLPRAAHENAPRYNLSFHLDEDHILQLKVALSCVDAKGAQLNMETEIPDWNFEKVRQHAVDTWNSYLNRIEIEATPKQKEILYTSLYHFFLQPSNIADVDGKYRGADNKIRIAPEHAYYSTLSIWDIYRGAYPLLQIIAPERVNGIVQTLLLHHKATGFLPIWTAWGQDNYCMIGNHAIPMLLSAVNNGFTGFNKTDVLQAMLETSTNSHVNSDWQLYNQYGYYPFDKLDNEAVSRTLESGYDDWCVSEMATKLGENKIADTFRKRADYYKNLYDSTTRMMRGKDTRGNWRTPFDPLAATSPMNNPGDYTEANAWQYCWASAQYDIPGMKKLQGGQQAFTKQLNDFFSIQSANPNKFLGQEAMIGQYAHGNEPGHHVVYLYAYSDQPKTGQKYIHRIINEFYSNTPNGMIGNDDCGQMSAWYILSCLGFYPVNPATSQFVLGAPQLKKATVHLPGGKKFIVEAKNMAETNFYVQKSHLNGIAIRKEYITYQDIMQGGNLKFVIINK